jgi:hypothetical protein
VTDLMSVQDKTSKWKSGVTPGKEQTVNPMLGMQRQVGNKKTGDLVGQKKEVSAGSVTSEQATSAFEKLAPVVDVIVPKAGDSGSLTAALKIPVSHGVFVGIKVGATASRGNSGTVTLGVTANVTAGATVGVATATFELGSYLQVQGRDAREAMVIVSWVLYRQLAESNAPREVEQAWFGTKKTEQTAEQYDALVQKTLFSNETGNWAEVGAQIGASVSGGVGTVLTGTVGARLRSGRKYTSESIDRRKGAKSLTQQVTSKLGIDRGAQASLGDRVFSVIGYATFSVPIAKGALSVTVQVRQVKDKQGKQEQTSYKLEKITVTGTASVTGMGVIASSLARGKAVQGLVKKVATKTEAATDKAKKELKSEKGRDVGEVMEDLDGLSGAMTIAAGEVQSLASTLTTILGLTVTGQVHISGGVTGGKPNLKLAFEKVSSLAVTAGVFSLTAKKTERMASIEFATGKWTAYLGEISKEIGKKKTTTTGGGKSTTSSSKPSGGGTGGKGGGKGTP